MFKIFAKLGGEDAALDALHVRMSKQDIPRKRPRKRISKLTLKKWKWRRQIPGAVILLLEAECCERGIACDLSDFKADDAAPDDENAVPASREAAE